MFLLIRKRRAGIIVLQLIHGNPATKILPGYGGSNLVKQLKSIDRLSRYREANFGDGPSKLLYHTNGLAEKFPDVVVKCENERE